jgi:hypothetical protein
MLFCALFVLAMAVPAFAAVQNVKVSGDMDMRYIARDNFDLIKGTGSAGEDQSGVFNTVTRVKVEADLTDNVQTVIRLINERNWDSAGTTNTDIDIDLAYVTMKEFLYSPLTMTIGRQELHFGNDMVIGDVNTNMTTNHTEATGYENRNGDLSPRKSFDSIRATLNYDPLVIDVVYAKIVDGIITGSLSSDDVNLYGVNVGHKFNDKRNSMIEGYVWNRSYETNATLVPAATADKADTVTTIGGRVSSNIIEKVNVQQEIAWQGGKKVTGVVSKERNAWASQTMATVTPGWKHSPVIGMIYSYFSGDADSANADTSKKYHAWDSMYENQTAGSIVNAIFGQSNVHDIDLMAKISPEFLKDVTIRGDWVYVALAKEMSANTAGAANDYSAGYVFAADKKYLGQELDLTVTYDYTEDVQFGLLCGYFDPGRAIVKSSANRENASQVIASCKVAF